MHAHTNIRPSKAKPWLSPVVVAAIESALEHCHTAFYYSCVNNVKSSWGNLKEAAPDEGMGIT